MIYVPHFKPQQYRKRQFYKYTYAEWHKIILGKIIKFLTESVSPAVSTCEHFCTFAFTSTYHNWKLI